MEPSQDNVILQNSLGHLIKLQLDQLRIDEEFHRENWALQKKYWDRSAELRAIRSAIIEGSRKPDSVPEECQILLNEVVESDSEESEEESGHSESEESPSGEHAPANATPEPSEDTSTAAESDAGPPVGIRKFWLRILRSAPDFDDIINDQDAQVLVYLKDITFELGHQGAEDHMWHFDFHFHDNPFFSDQKLTKSFRLELSPNSQKPWDYNGEKIVGSVGSTIHWRPHKSVIQRPHRRDSELEKRHRSFFCFFDPLPPVGPMSQDDVDEIREDDFSKADVLRDIVQRPIWYWMGKVEYFDDDDESDEESESESEG